MAAFITTAKTCSCKNSFQMPGMQGLRPSFKTISAMRNFFLLLPLPLLFLAFTTAAQQRTLTGKVFSSKTGEALSSVTVSQGGHTVASGNDGSFSLVLPMSKTTVTVTAVGYVSKSIQVEATQSNLSISLETDEKRMDEVVVVGYNERRRGELTSAVTVVDSRKLKDVTTNNIGSMLQGKVAGLQVVNGSGVPGAQPELRLRGVSSVNATQAPLFVVDGIIGGNYDPNDVESVTVLKDAGATAMYGSQANGGVVIVSTKRARAGKTRYEAKITTGFRRPDFGQMKMMNGTQLWEYQRQLYRDYIPGAIDNSYKIDLVKFYAERPPALRDQNYNWLNTIFSNALVQNYYASFAGRSEKNDYYIGASYFDEQGTFMNTGFKRLNLRANSNFKLSSRINLTNNINLSGARGNSYDYNDIYYAYLNLPWDNPYDSGGTARYVDGNSPFKWWSRDKINPVHSIQNSDHPYTAFDVNYDLGLNIGITSWLSFASSNRFAASNNKAKNYFSPLVAGSYHNSGYVDENTITSYGLVSNQLLRFNLPKGDHQISGLAGFAYEKNKTEAVGGSGTGLPVGLSTLSVAANNLRPTGYNTQTSIQSFISQANYSYRNKYFLTASYRLDGSSNFPENNRWASFPSVSAAWAVNNESFFNSRMLDNLRLRVGYGVTGTQDIGAGRYLGLYSLSTQYSGQAAARPLQLPNPNLTWESKYQLNAGLDVALWRRVNLTVDVYRNLTKNLLLQVAQPLSVGFETRWENTGEIENRGVEFTLGSLNVQSKSFEWATDFNINFNQNKLRNLPAPIIKTGSWAISQIYRNGGNLYEFYMPKWAGVNAQTGAPQWEKQTKDAQGNVTKTDVTSNYSEATLQEVGSALPKFQGGMTNRLRYQNLTFSFNAYFVSGNKVFSNNLRFVMNDGNEPYMNQAVLPSGYSIWTKSGENATNPSPQNSANSTQTSSRYLMDGSYLALRNVTLAYELPASLSKRLRAEGITVSVSADNVHTFTKFFGQDPQTTIAPGTYVSPGVSDFKYPNNRQFLFNLNFRF